MIADYTTIELVVTVASAVAGFIFTVAATVWGIYWKIYPRIVDRLNGLETSVTRKLDDTEKNVREQFNRAEEKVEEQFERTEKQMEERFVRAEAARETLRLEVADRRHDHANRVQLITDEINTRIDLISTQFVRREDFTLLIQGLATTTQAVSLLSNVVSRLEGTVGPLIANLPRILGSGMKDLK